MCRQRAPRSSGITKPDFVRAAGKTWISVPSAYVTVIAKSPVRISGTRSFGQSRAQTIDEQDRRTVIEALRPFEMTMVNVVGAQEGGFVEKSRRELE
jgi:hypothetical protein